VRREDGRTRLNGAFSHKIRGKEGRRTMDPDFGSNLPSVPQPERVTATCCLDCPRDSPPCDSAI